MRSASSEQRIILSSSSAGVCNMSPGDSRSHNQHRSPYIVYKPCLEVLEDRTLLSFITAPTYAAGTNPYSVAVGDFNGDGIPDLAVTDSLFSNGTVGVLLGKRGGSFQSAQSYNAGILP